MDARGIETAIISVSTPGVEPGELEEARRVARELNEYSAQMVADHPGRYGFFATLTLPDVDGALEEAAYALDELNADGIVLHAHSHGIYLGDTRFDALMDELQRRQAKVFIHPSDLVGDAVRPYVADCLLDSVEAAANLARSGTLDRCPDIKWFLSHAGGFIRRCVDTRMVPHVSSSGVVEDELEVLRRFYYDTALASSPFSMPSLLAFAYPSHITYGCDFPYVSAAEGALFTGKLDANKDADHHAINRGNAEALFPRLADPS